MKAWVRVATVLAALLVGVASSARAQTEVTSFTYNHQGTNIDVEFITALKPRQTFTVNVENTCPTEFDYKLVGLTKDPAQIVFALEGGRSRLGTVPLSVVFDSQYSGYELKIARKPQPTRCVTTDGHDIDNLNEVTVTVRITALEWEVGQDAALTLTGWTNHAWTTQPTAIDVTSTGADGKAATSKVTKYKVVRDSEAQDPARVNFATMTHLYPPGSSWGPALGFGLVDNNAEYYFAVGGGFGERNRRILNWTAGVVYTPIGRLPAGIAEGDLLDDAAALKDFRRARVFRPFFGITATFFRATGNEQKPVAKPQ
jgi:hypothetical protein